MIPSMFDINVRGDGNSPVPVQITIGPLVFMLGIVFALVGLFAIAKKARK